MSDASLNRFLSRGTAAQRAAFTPVPPSPASGPDPGYLWYETDTGLLYAYDGAAWDRIGVTYATKGSDQSKTSDLTFSDVTDLAFAVGSGETWVAEYHVYIDAGTAGDLSLAINAPASSTGFWTGIRLIGGVSGTSGDLQLSVGTDVVTDAGFRTVPGAGAGTLIYAALHLKIVTAGAGNVVLRMAQTASSGTASTLKAGSFLVARRVN